MPLGHVMMDLAGTELLPGEKAMLMHPVIAGVVLFARNFESPEQLRHLTHEIRQLRQPRLLIAVDQEGGRVQRFRDGFTRLPAMGEVGHCYRASPQEGLALAQDIGWLMASECLAAGVDFSFAPVADLDYGDSHVIGDRAFERDPMRVSELTRAVMAGMHRAGMAAVAKHFPGHGFIQADTHHEVATDERPFDQIRLADLQPFLGLIEAGVKAVMPAHVRYPKVDALPAGFSEVWLQKILRAQCHFQGAIVSDDLTMHAAATYGSPLARVELARNAGCDLTLLCNDPEAVQSVCEQSPKVEEDPVSQARLIGLHGHGDYDFDQAWSKLHQDPRWQAARQRLDAFSDRQNQQSLL
ncbi:beta-N-acetylhexosaminidase [Hydrogenovibrio halophilus]|uniref:beta-N-acetylhexosaminidase n=1 Tax=Hydrogenovibrio halophilus TaxID=373391 RepID=UPI00048BE0F3|nr:beta-N-acetylhexosaminidase [Hydrogenovibrio halophilus]